MRWLNLLQCDTPMQLRLRSVLPNQIVAKTVRFLVRIKNRKTVLFRDRDKWDELPRDSMTFEVRTTSYFSGE